MTHHARTASWLLLVTFGMTGTVFGDKAPTEIGNKVALAKGERILVMQARHFFTGSKVVDGTGSALVQSVHNALVELELSPAPGSYAAVINAIGECETVACSFLVLPRLERYTPKSTLRSRVRVTIQLIEASSRQIVADCDATEMGWRHKGERVQELMRPAVEACLDQLITVKSGEARPALPAMDEFLVAPFRELWVLPGNETPEESDYLADALLESLKLAKHRGELGPSGAKRRELFEHARKMKCNRILSVYGGLVWTHREKPPDDVHRS